GTLQRLGLQQVLPRRTGAGVPGLSVLGRQGHRRSVEGARVLRGGMVPSGDGPGEEGGTGPRRRPRGARLSLRRGGCGSLPQGGTLRISGRRFVREEAMERIPLISSVAVVLASLTCAQGAEQ